MLFIINFFVTFFLLQVTAKLTKKKAGTIRFILSSVAGGLYSMIILADELPVYILTISKIIAAAVIILIAFSFHRLRAFCVTMLVFLFVNFLFLGIIIGIYFLTKSELIAINNSVFYFNVSARGLLLCAFVSYLLSCLIVRLYNRTLSKNEIYKIVIENSGDMVTLFAFCDTGNKLREPFSDYPVIIVNRLSVEKIVGESVLRIIPTSTVNNLSLLRGFKPDRVTIKTSDGEEVIENVYIALSDDIENDSFSAVLNPEILSV